MIKSWLALIESNTSGTGRLFAHTARQLGYCPVLISDDPLRYSWVREDAIESRMVATNDASALRNCIAELRAEAPIAGVLSSSEYFIEAAARLARFEGLPGGNPEAIAMCRDKRRQRHCLKDAGILVPVFSCATSNADVVAALNEQRYPLVVKPAFGTGSIGVRLCRTVEEVLQHAEGLLARTVNERGATIEPAILIEEYLSGPEYSVEIFDAHVVGITRKLLSPEPLFIENGHDFPADIPGETAAQIAETAQRVLAAIGLHWGPAHIEIRLTARGPAVIEINPRLAGGFIPELVRQATGVDLIEQTLQVAVGRSLLLQPTHLQHASIRFVLTPVCGVLEAVEGLDEARAMPGVTEVQIYRRVGDQLCVHGDFRDRIGHVITLDQSFDRSASAAENALQAIRLRIA
jgi:biotin carboxylase